VRWLTAGSPKLLLRARFFEHTELSELAVNYEKSTLGFVTTFLHKYILAAMGCCFAISALVMDLPIVKGYLLNNGVAVQAKNVGGYPGNLENLLKGLFCAGAVIIPLGAVLCKFSPGQPLDPAAVRPLLPGPTFAWQLWNWAQR